MRYHSTSTALALTRAPLAPLARTISALLVSAAGVLGAAACHSGDVADAPAPSGGVLIQPARSIHLRASFDNDPTAYLGRMVTRTGAEAALDENDATQTRCSRYVTAKLVDANQDMDEVVYASTQASASLGVPGIASASASKSNDGTLRVHYHLSHKLQSVVSDPDKYAQCCAAAPDQCSDKMIGTFLMGSGQVYERASAAEGGSAQGASPHVAGSVEYKDNVGWKRVNSFNDTYFAFLVQAAPVAGGLADNRPSPAADASCGWCDTIPTSLDGNYFCGISPNAVEESSARNLALRDAREQVINYLGEYLTTQSSSASSALKGYISDEHVVSAASSGISSQVKDVKWCPAERSETPNGKTYKSKVLAFLPEGARKAAAKATLEAIIQTRKADGKLSADEEKALRASIAQLQ